VEGGEGTTVLLLTVNVFLLLTAYYIIKPVREALILAGGGAELKAYASAGQAFLLLLAVPIYARLAERVPRRRLINLVTLFFVACLGLFYVLAQARVPLGVVFYLWVGIFNLMVVAQFWAFANDIYTPNEGKRLFAIIAFGASGGAVLGSRIASWLIEPLGTFQLLLVSGGILLFTLVLTNLVDTREKRRQKIVGGAAALEAEEPVGKGNAFLLVLRNNYLLLIALLILVLNVVNTTGEYLLGRLVQQAAEQAAAAAHPGAAQDVLDDAVRTYAGRFYGDFYFVVNLLSLGIQLLLVSRILKFLGVRIALLIPPLVALGGYFFLAFVPVLAVVRWSKTAENSLDYSLMNTLRGVLFLPTTREEKYKAKQAIDTFFVRTGDALQAGLVFAGTTWWGFHTRDFAYVAMGLVVVWIGLAFAVGVRYRKLVGRQERIAAQAGRGILGPETRKAVELPDIE